MTDEPKLTHELVLNEIHAAIDLPEDVYEKVEARYKSLSEWLDRPGSTIKHLDPYVTPQGSIKLGTANLPIGENDELDVDLICRLLASKADLSQKALKAKVGAELRAYTQAHDMTHEPEDKRRCWTLEYVDDRHFHVDVLPCIPDAEQFRKRLFEAGYQALAGNLEISGEAVAITDKTDPGYDQIADDWPTSNPLGYANWFWAQMAERARIQKQQLMERTTIYAHVDEIPNFRIKTTLQKVVQLLKRHRDIMFADNPEHKPISIIISTLAARAYSNEETLVGALRVILTGMDEFIKERGGATWIENPVNPAENFADKWQENSEKQKNFNRWLTAARRDFGNYLNASKPEDVPQELGDRLGRNLVEKVLKARSPSGAVVAPAILAGLAADRADAMVEDVNQRGTGTKPWCA